MVHQYCLDHVAIGEFEKKFGGFLSVDNFLWDECVESKSIAYELFSQFFGKCCNFINIDDAFFVYGLFELFYPKRRNIVLLEVGEDACCVQ